MVICSLIVLVGFIGLVMCPDAGGVRALNVGVGESVIERVGTISVVCEVTHFDIE